MRDRKNYQWFIAGATLGAMGLYAGRTMMGKKNIKKTRAAAARLTNRVSREAGDMISSMGRNLADKMR